MYITKYLLLLITFLVLLNCGNDSNVAQNSLNSELTKFLNSVKKERFNKLEPDSTTNIIVITFCSKDNEPIVFMRDAVFYFSYELDYAFLKDDYLIVYDIQNQACFNIFNTDLNFNKSILLNYSDEKSQNALETIYENSERLFKVDNKGKLLQVDVKKYSFDCDE